VLTDTSGRITGERGDQGVAAVTAAVAQQVRALRQARGWSLDELSGRSGVSKGMVVQIEAARTNPSVGTLSRLSDAFDVSIARLLEPAAERIVRISPADQAPTLWRGGYGGFGRLLAGVNAAELWEWRLQPREHHESPDHAIGTRELIHVLVGEVTVTVDGTAHLVRAGETIDFPSDRTHGYRNDAAEPARMVMVVVLPAAV
jgi:transcriptional regulator with XRE-family HTH domain